MIIIKRNQVEFYIAIFGLNRETLCRYVKNINTHKCLITVVFQPVMDKHIVLYLFFDASKNSQPSL